MTSVTIVGAGLGGLLLARFLQINGVPATIYEADPSPATRRQGGQLDIHEHDGQRALAAADLTDQFRAIIHQGAEAVRMVDPRGTLLFEQIDDGTGGRPEVLRGDLRDLLIASLSPETIRWGKKLVQVTPLGDGRHTLTFANGEQVTTGLLGGADGAWSKIRPLLSDVMPTYAGVTFVETFLHDVDARHPAAAAMVGGGALFALTPGKGIVTHREAGDTLHTYVELRRSADWIEAVDFEDAEAATARIAAEFDGWAPALIEPLTLSDTPPVARMVHVLPTGHRWDRVPGVTLIGDAAHLMPPMGEGANLALFDAAELGQAIIAHPGDVEAALAVYEAAMFTRAASSSADSHAIMDLCLDARAPDGLIDFFRSASCD